MRKPLLLAALIVLYLLGGAAVFSALELAHERQAKQRWEERRSKGQGW